MVRLDLTFAIASVIMTKLKACGENIKTVEFTVDDVVTLGHQLEEKTGIAVLNGFTENAAREFLQTRRWFQSACALPGEQQTYKLNTCIRAYNQYSGREAIMTILDPPRNYPIEILEAAGILEWLDGRVS